jgi:hypothetical protein
MRRHRTRHGVYVEHRVGLLFGRRCPGCRKCGKYGLIRVDGRRRQRRLRWVERRRVARRGARRVAGFGLPLLIIWGLVGTLGAIVWVVVFAAWLALSIMGRVARTPQRMPRPGRARTT